MFTNLTQVQHENKKSYSYWNQLSVRVLLEIWWSCFLDLLVFCVFTVSWTLRAPNYKSFSVNCEIHPRSFKLLRFWKIIFTVIFFFMFGPVGLTAQSKSLPLSWPHFSNLVIFNFPLGFFKGILINSVTEVSENEFLLHSESGFFL